jgi:hypothetical protein
MKDSLSFRAHWMRSFNVFVGYALRYRISPCLMRQSGLQIRKNQPSLSEVLINAFIKGRTFGVGFDRSHHYLRDLRGAPS